MEARRPFRTRSVVPRGAPGDGPRRRAAEQHANSKSAALLEPVDFHPRGIDHVHNGRLQCSRSANLQTTTARFTAPVAKTPWARIVVIVGAGGSACGDAVAAGRIVYGSRHLPPPSALRPAMNSSAMDGVPATRGRTSSRARSIPLRRVAILSSASSIPITTASPGFSPMAFRNRAGITLVPPSRTRTEAVADAMTAMASVRLTAMPASNNAGPFRAGFRKNNSHAARRQGALAAPPRTMTRASTRTRTSSMSRARTSTIWPSAAGALTASALRSPASTHQSASVPWSGASPTFARPNRN